jgi:hypothetical protein
MRSDRILSSDRAGCVGPRGVVAVHRRVAGCAWVNASVSVATERRFPPPWTIAPLGLDDFKG